MAGPRTSGKRVRRTQAERSAGTRNVLLDASIKCLFEHGYGATTTILVAEVAGVSRGAMLHQFPTKADLMTFVVEEVFAQDVALYRRLLTGIDDPRQRLVAYPNAVWKVLSRPAGIAVLEILQGSRSDKALAAKLAPVQAKIESYAKDALQREVPRGVHGPLFQLIVGAVRGLSVTQVLAPRNEDVVQAISLFQHMLQVGIDAGLFSNRSSASSPNRRKAGSKSMAK